MEDKTGLGPAVVAEPAPVPVTEAPVGAPVGAPVEASADEVADEVTVAVVSIGERDGGA